MIKILELDVENTIHFYKKMKNKLEKGQCYNNTLNLIIDYLLPQFQCGIVKIGYCYVGGEDHQLLRHCVAITYENKVIDISCLLNHSKESLTEYINNYNIRYYIFADLNCEEYSQLLEKEDLNPDLAKSLKEHEKEMLDFSLKNNMDINRCDFAKYIM